MLLCRHVNKIERKQVCIVYIRKHVHNDISVYIAMNQCVYVCWLGYAFATAFGICYQRFSAS